MTTDWGEALRSMDEMQDRSEMRARIHNRLAALPPAGDTWADRYAVDVPILLAELDRLSLTLIEVANPGIDMDAVRQERQPWSPR